MLVRHTGSNGVVYYASPLLGRAGVPHAFSTRVGGISAAPFDSLNLGNPNGCDVQDDHANIRDNYRLLQDSAGCGDREVCRVHQVHGPAVVRARRGEAFDTSSKADAIISDDPARVVSVRVADCVPVLLARGDGRVVAAVHAGWRGVVAGVVTRALGEMNDQGGSPPDAVVAAIGPCIGEAAFEVGPEVVEAFVTRFGERAPVRRRPDGKGHVDLKEAVRLQLIDAGVPQGQIDSTDRCTFEHASEFFSHRRDNGVTGRLAAIVGAVRL